MEKGDETQANARGNNFYKHYLQNYSSSDISEFLVCVAVIVI